MASTVGPEAFCAQQNANLGRPDSRPLLPAIACPAAVIHGAGDQLLPVEHGEELAAGIAGAQRTIVGGCGHMSTLERPAEVGAALGGLLDAAA
jgi:pimeloyl-ACP methyl ester carboxylesterase